MRGGAWHYICAFGFRFDDLVSDDDLLCSSRIWFQIEGRVEGLLARFGPTGLADMDGATIAALEGCGDADLWGQDVAERIPGIIDARRLELEAHGMDDAIGEQADEQMAFDAGFLVVVDGS